MLALLNTSTSDQVFADADIVIEAVTEDEKVKTEMYRKLAGVLKDDAILASNTSTISITRMAESAPHPERFVGMHFFSPVDRMPLLEVIPHAGTDPDTIVTAVRFGRRMGKTVIVVRDRPGFWVNRILAPYLNEAGVLLEEGVPIELIDRAMTRWGFPVGPIALLDEVGLDVAYKAAQVMHEAFGERMSPPAALARMVEDKRLGRKAGRGFYVYHDNHKTGVDERAYRAIGVKPLEGFAAEDIQQRLVYAMLNEAALAYAEGVVRSARDGDIGALFGFGFPAFRGGPLRMIDDLGPARVVETLQHLATAHGSRFAPAPALAAMAASGGRFHAGPGG